MRPMGDEGKELQWLPTQNAMSTARYRGILLHSSGDPVQEAEKVVAPLMNTQTPFYLIFGLGLAYHVMALREKLPDVEILVFEPSEEIYQAAKKVSFKNWPGDPKVRVFQRIEDLEDLLIDQCIYSSEKPFPVLWVYPPYRSWAGEEIRRLDTLIHSLRIRQATNLKTQKEKKSIWLQNILVNWPKLITLPNVCQLKGAFQKIPCVIIGTGPSLEQSSSSLRRLQGKSILFSAGSVLGWLKENGIQPNLAGVLEGEDVSGHLRAHRENDAEWLGLSSSTHPHHYMAASGRHFVFHTEPWVAEALAQEPFIPQGGNISSAAFTMAIVMGCNPIILVGLDLSYGEGELHVSGARDPGDEEVLKFKRFTLPGQKGVVSGHSAMVSYLSWFEESSRYLAKARPDLLLINATAAGARIRDFEDIRLEEVEAFLDPLQKDIPSILHDQLILPEIDRRAIRKRLEEIYLMVSRAERLTAELLQHPAGHLYQWLMQGELTIAEEGGPRLNPKMVGQALKVVQLLIEKTEEKEDRTQRIYRTFSYSGDPEVSWKRG